MKNVNKGAANIDDVSSAQMRHTIKSSRLLYSAPNVVLRAPIYLIFWITVVALIYSFWAKKDEMVIAPLTLQRESITVQAVGGGIVSDILTEENAPIAAGDPIVVVQEQIRAATSPEQQALISHRRELEKDLDKMVKDYDHEISQLELDLEDLQSTKSTEKANLGSRIDMIRLQLATARRAKQSLERKYELAEKRYRTKKELYDSHDLTITEFEEAEEAVNDLEAAIHDAQAEIQKVGLSLQSAGEERSKLNNLHREEKIARDLAKLGKNRNRDIADLGEKIVSLSERIEGIDTLVRGVSYSDNKARYRSTFDGIVTSLHVRKGQLVDAGASLATIVKESAALEGRVMVLNQDIGRLKHGQPVMIKYFAYPYQDYGMQMGTIVDIATKSGGADVEPGMYMVRVALHKETIKRPGSKVKRLEIGLEGMAEIKTGEKKLIELIFTPISKFFTKPEE